MVESPKGTATEMAPVEVSARNGGRILADALRLHGVDRVFCVPGESYLDLLDALYDMPEIHLVVAKHEGAAANMAEADGKLTGRPGICMVTRGPGATHASAGVHTAFQDSTPMILLIGQVATSVRGREAFQEVEFSQMFAPLAKWTAEITDPARIPEYMSRAFECASSGRPGPVVLSLPEDVLAGSATVRDSNPARVLKPAPAPGAVDALREELARAHRPLVIVGGPGWTDEACVKLAAFAEENALPVAVSFRRQDLLDNEHPSYIGHLTLGTAPYLAKRVKSADLIVALGCRLGDVTTGSYSLIPIPRTSQRLVHVHAGAEELNRVHHADLAIHAAPSHFADVLQGFTPFPNASWRSWTYEGHQEFLAFTTPREMSPPTGVDFAEVVAYLSRTLPSDAIVCNGAGNYTVWVHRFFRYKQRATELAPVSGSMGYGFPASIAAKLRHPDRTVISFAGDGCFLMYAQELATAVQFGAAVIVIVVNNGMYATIRMHQERRFPGRVSGTNLSNPDFVALARAYGAHGEKVETTEAFEAAFERARRFAGPSLIELRVDPNQITPDRRLD